MIHDNADTVASEVASVTDQCPFYERTASPSEVVR